MIKISKSRGGATASFPYDAKLVADIQQMFEDAKWSADAKCWTVPGDRAFERLTAWADSHNCAAAAAEADLKPVADALWANREIFASVAGRTATLAFEYDADAVAVAKNMPGAKFDRKKLRWSVTASSLADVSSPAQPRSGISSSRLPRRSPWPRES